MNAPPKSDGSPRQNDTRPRFRIGRFEECCAGLRDPNWFIVLKRLIDKIDDISFELTLIIHGKLAPYDKQRVI